MINNRIEGFVVNRTNYKESDAIINVLTTDGIFTFKARGILKPKSKNASACNFFTLSEFDLTSKTEESNNTLKSAITKKMYRKPYDDLNIMSSYLFISNLAYQIADNVNTYSLCLECFDLLENERKPLSILVYYLKEITNRLGYEPNLLGCIECNKKNNLVSFSLSDGGFICSTCRKEDRHELLGKEYLKDIYLLYKDNKYDTILDNRLLKLFNMYVEFLKNEVGIIINNTDLVLKSL